MEAEVQRLVAAIAKISEVYLVRLSKSGDEEGMLKYTLRLADYSTRLAVILSPSLSRAEVADLAPAVEPAPNFGDSKKMSSELYGEFATKWMQRTFPHLYADWPPTVHATSPQSIAEAATRDGVLAQVTAAGVFGPPDGYNAGLGDFSLYTALVGETRDDGQFTHNVWHMGKLVGTAVGGPDIGLDFAKSLGFDW